MLHHHGVRPLEFMASLGWTGPDVWYAHGIHFNDEELRELARTGIGALLILTILVFNFLLVLPLKYFQRHSVGR